jgi:ATP-dependent DNA helicase 2 subunit 2
MIKAAAVLVLDTTIASDADFDKACQICEDVIVDKAVYAASDEVAVVLAGTATSRSTLYEKSEQTRYNHITVDKEMCAASHHSLNSIITARQMRQRDEKSFAFDFIDALTVAADVLLAKTAGRKYTRAIYFITDARHTVVHKTDLETLYSALAHDSVALVVVGLNFYGSDIGLLNKADGCSLIAQESSWDTWSVKRQNEEILRGLCAALGTPSRVVSLADAASSLSMPRCRRVQQKPIIRVPLRIGDIRIATQLFTLSQEERLPALQRCTRDGVAVKRAVHYETLTLDSNGHEERHDVREEDVATVFFFGTDAIACNADERKAMQVEGPAALDTVAFVKESEVAPYVLMGGTRVLLPFAGDGDGQRGYNALVEAMETTQSAMLVRLVVKSDAAPSLCACFAHRCGADDGEENECCGLPRCLVVAPLPFAEDVRDYEFSEYPELYFTSAEEQMMDDLIDGLSVGDSVLAPQNTFNPVLQQYYATLAMKLKTIAARSEAATTAETQVSPLVPQLQGTSTNFFVTGSVVYERMLKCRPLLEVCAATFPFSEIAESSTGDDDDCKANPRPSTANNDGKRRGRFRGNEQSWYRSHVPTAVGADVAEEEERPQTPSKQWRSGGDDAADAVSSSPPSTMAAPVVLRRRIPTPSHAPSDLVSIATIPHNVGEGGAPGGSAVAAAASVTTASDDLVERVHLALHQPREKVTQVCQAKKDLCEDIIELLRSSRKGSVYQTILDRMSALRACCLEEKDAQFYNTFFFHLEKVAEECGKHEDFWNVFVIKGAGSGDGCGRVWPITTTECGGTTFISTADAGHFLGQ